MLGKLNAWIHAALAPQGLLVLNHLVLAEPVARERLRTQVGKCFELQVQGVPQWVGPLPTLRLRITPAGLFEAVDALEMASGESPAAVDLTLTVQARPPWEAASAALQGQVPEVDIAGDSALATELNWLAKNLRWDVADDLQRLFGPGPAQAVSQAAKGVADLVRAVLKSAPGPRP